MAHLMRFFAARALAGEKSRHYGLSLQKPDDSILMLRISGTALTLQQLSLRELWYLRTFIIPGWRAALLFYRYLIIPI